jgi:hypothetical protein
MASPGKYWPGRSVASGRESRGVCWFRAWLLGGVSRCGQGVGRVECRRKKGQAESSPRLTDREKNERMKERKKRVEFEKSRFDGFE